MVAGSRGVVQSHAGRDAQADVAVRHESIFTTFHGKRKWHNMELFKAFRVNKTDKLIIQSIIRTSLFGLKDKGDSAGGRERQRVESREKRVESRE